MPTSLIIVLIAFLVFGGRMLCLFLGRRKTMSLLPVEAGPTDSAKEDFTTPVKIRIGDMRLQPEYEYFLVRNECMVPRHISSGDVIGVQLFDENFTIADVKEGDILLIYLDDERFHGHKIRVMSGVQRGAFSTYYYIGNRKKESSQPHEFGSIRGVVREINHPYHRMA